MGEEIAYRAYTAGAPILWVAHRRELVKQARKHIGRRFNQGDIGLIFPGEPHNPDAKVQVATVQTMLASGHRPAARLVVWDEAHHYVADDWSQVREAYPEARHLGLTATPERSDGRALGDMFDTLVVAAQYSELIEQGHIVPCAVYQPPERLDANEMALNPVKAYKEYGAGGQAFCFASSVELAEKYAKAFSRAGYPAAVIEANTPAAERDSKLEAFDRGRITVLCNVYTLTEGVDIPQASVCILARGCSHPSPYLQMCGRVLRPHPGKTEARLIDLTGVSLAPGFGYPTEDRIYSLTGDAIKTTRTQALKVCLRCGYTMPSTDMRCPRCQYVFVPKPIKQPYIHDIALRRVYDGKDTPTDARYAEYLRLREIQKREGHSCYWTLKRYKHLFGQPPSFADVTQDEKKEEYKKLVAQGRAKNIRQGAADVRFKGMFGHWPSRAMRSGV
jgi:ribosomal protein L40E